MQGKGGGGKGILISGKKLNLKGWEASILSISSKGRGGGGVISISSILGLEVWIKGWGGLIGKPSCLSEIEIQVRRFHETKQWHR